MRNYWKCQCNQINHNDYEVCVKCNTLKPGLSGWVCKVCKVKNKEGTYKCSTCENRMGTESTDQNFWLCDICGSANNFKNRVCAKCNKFRIDYGFDRDKASKNPNKT